MSDHMIDIVIELHLDLVLDLSGNVQDTFLLDWTSEVQSIFSEEIELTDMSPRVKSVAHGVHGPDSDVLTTSEEVESVDFPVKILPVHDEGQPGEGVDEIEQSQIQGPVEIKGVDEEHIPGRWDE